MKLLCLKNHDTLKSGKVYEISYVETGEIMDVLLNDHFKTSGLTTGYQL